MKLKRGFIDMGESKPIYIHDLDEDFDKVNQGSCGTDWVVLTEEQLEALKNGKVLQLSENGWEYSMFMKYGGK